MVSRLIQQQHVSFQTAYPVQFITRQHQHQLSICELIHINELTQIERMQKSRLVLKKKDFYNN